MAIKEDPKGRGTYFVSHHKRHPITRIPISLKRKIVGSLQEAKRAEAEVIFEVEQRVRQILLPNWGELIEDWAKAVQQEDVFVTNNLGLQTFEDYMFALRTYTRNWYGKSPAEISRQDAWSLLHQIEKSLSVGRRKRVRSAIDAVYRWAMLSGRIRHDLAIPTEGFKSAVKSVEQQPEILTLSEIRKLLRCAKDIEHPWYRIWAMALFTGMRSGELYAMEWSQIDFDSNLIFVHRNWTNRTGFGPTKGRYWRTVPIESGEVLTLLKELKLESAGKANVLPRYSDWGSGDQAAILRQFCRGIGIPSVRFHTLRACFATQLIKDSIAPAIVMKICGWKDLKTMQRYIRLAGLEVKGATEHLKFLPEERTAARVVELFGGENKD